MHSIALASSVHVEVFANSIGSRAWAAMRAERERGQSGINSQFLSTVFTLAGQGGLGEYGMLRLNSAL